MLRMIPEGRGGGPGTASRMAIRPARWSSSAASSSSWSRDLRGVSAAPEGDPRQRHALELQVSKVLRSGLELEVDGHGHGPCDGDSGGPAFLRLPDGSLRPAGIDSRGYGCGAKSIYGAPFPALCWLRDEAAVDRLPPGCESCDCIETARGCECSSSRGHAGRGWSLLAVLVAWRRREARLRPAAPVPRGPTQSRRSRPVGRRRSSRCAVWANQW